MLILLIFWTTTTSSYYDERDNRDAIFNSKQENETIKIWMYVPEHPQLPNPEFPIAQSYVDIILRGCLSISEEFAKEFIINTRGWHAQELMEDESVVALGEYCWVDDREKPIYVRADTFFSNKRAKQLDYMLQRHKPDAFTRRVRFDSPKKQ